MYNLGAWGNVLNEKHHGLYSPNIIRAIKDILQGADTVKFIISLRLRWYGHVEYMQGQRASNQIATATMERERKNRDCVKDGEARG